MSPAPVRLFRALALVASMASPAAYGQTTWHVDADGDAFGNGTVLAPFDHLQDALDHPLRAAGDLILVRGGTYHEQVTISGPDVHIAPWLPAHGPVVFDGQGTQRPFDVVGPAQVTLEGLTITGGFAGVGAGVRAENALVELIDCRLEDNLIDPIVIAASGAGLHATDCTVIAVRTRFADHEEGGAVDLTDCRALFDDCVVADNRRFGTVFGPASGLNLIDTWAVVRGTDFLGNGVPPELSIDGVGGALRALGGGLVVESCAFLGNWNEFRGGSLALADLNALVRDCTFTDERSFDLYGGGAIYLHDGAPVSLDLVGCRFEGCRAGDGGALHLTGGSVFASDCEFVDNLAVASFFIPETGRGGAVHAMPGSFGLFSGCRFIGNQSIGDQFLLEGQGGAVWGDVLLDRCTLFENDATDDSGTGQGDAAYDAELYQCVAWGGQPDALAGPFALATFSNVEGGFADIGNVDLDPLYWNPDTRDLHLMPDSPCRDVGDPLSPLDADGTPPEMGAYPFVVGAYAPDPLPACTSEPDSQGSVALINWSGDPSLNPSTPFTLHAVDVRPGSFGWVFLGRHHASQGFVGGGVLCFASMLWRSQNAPTGGDPLVPGSGSLDVTVDPSVLLARGMGVGDPVVAQFWFHDPGAGMAQSDALVFTLQP